MEIEEDPPMGIPEWVVTFGDMMSLLLTFFIMLVSLSEIKEEEKFQALVESLRQQFGYTEVPESLAPGDSKPRTSSFDPLATVGRAQKKDTAKGGVPEKAPHGEEHHVRIMRNGHPTAIGSVIFFEPGTQTLTEKAKQSLKILAEQLRGKSQKIEARGHTAPEVAARAVGLTQVYALGYSRAEKVVNYLIEVEGIEGYRFRTSSVGDTEPMYNSGNPEKMGLNARVEVFLLDENAEDLRGSQNANSRQSAPATTSEEIDNG